MAVPLRADAIGAIETYGPGLIATDDSGETVTFALEASAGVVVLRVWPGWRLEPLYPMRRRDTTYFQVGTHTVPVPRPAPFDTLAAGHPPPRPGSQAAREQEAGRCIFQALQGQRPLPQGRAPGDTAAGQRGMPVPAEPVNIGAIEDRCRRAAGLDTAHARQPEIVVERSREYYVVLVASDQTLDARHLAQKLSGIDISGTDIVQVLQALPGFIAGARSRTWAGYAAKVEAK